MQEALVRVGFTDCTPIQEKTISLIIGGKDVAGLAQTGTGKTLAFLLPLMSRILAARDHQQSPPVVQAPSKTVNGDDEVPAPVAQADKPTWQDVNEADAEGDADGEDEDHYGEPRDLGSAQRLRPFANWKAGHFILVVVPTRELAEQVYENVNKFGEMSGLRGVAIYGGTSYDKQKEALRRGIQFVIATPGRLIDLYKSHLVDFKQVQAVVFDEADRMFDMGFKDDMKYILNRIPRARQFLVFSATLNFDVLTVAYEFGAHPIEVNVSQDQAKATNVKDEIMHVGANDRPGYLLSVLKSMAPKQAIIFTNFKFNVRRIAEFLTKNGVPAMGISSLLTQAQRNRVLSRFKEENEQNILVATDVAARGLDIKGVDMVINFELPDDAENYVHRIGRTGRAGEEGRAVSLVSENDIEALRRIEDYLKHKLPVGWLDDNVLIKDFLPFPASERPRFGVGDRYSGARGERPRGSSRPRPDQRERPGAYRGERGGPRGNERGGARGGEREERGERTERGERAPWSSRAAKTGEARREGTNSSRRSAENQQVHRDRRLGRHQTGQNESRVHDEKSRDRKRHSQPKPAQSKERTHHKKHGTRDGHAHLDAAKKSGRRKTSDLPNAGGVGSKLVRFFKNLFS